MREMLARVDSRELSEWAAYERVAGPLGGARGDIQAGIIAATVNNVNRKKGARPATPAKFVPEWGKGLRRQEPDEMFRQVAAFNRFAGGTTRDGEEA